jgi:aspartyl-tRNA(Asn)/glutamyl-tRNA(Gln) amidotransferase subunit A
MSVPCGLAEEDGLPVGLQIMAPALGEAVMYRVGAAYEAARDADDRDDGAAPLIQRVPGLEVTA